MANRMTRARSVTPGRAIAMIPTMTARMPSRIKEVDVDLNMKGIPSACLKRTTSSGKSEAPVMSRKRDGRRCWPTSAAYGAIAAGWGQAGSGAVQYGRERDGCRVRVVLGEPQRRPSNAHLPGLAVLFAKVGKGVLGALGLHDARQGVQYRATLQCDWIPWMARCLTPSWSHKSPGLCH